MSEDKCVGCLRRNIQIEEQTNLIEYLGGEIDWFRTVFSKLLDVK